MSSLSSDVSEYPNAPLISIPNPSEKDATQEVINTKGSTLRDGKQDKQGRLAFCEMEPK